jgi:hypothetical protein
MPAPLAVLTTIGSTLAWYDFVFFPCLILFVHPEKIIDWLSDLPGWKFGVPSVRAFQATAAVIVVTWSLVLFLFSSRFRWADPIVIVVLALIARGIRTLIVKYFGFERF